MVYRLTGIWQMYGTMLVEADNLEEAIKKSIDMPLPDNSGYIEDSFRLDKYGIVTSYPEEAINLSIEGGDIWGNRLLEKTTYI